MAKKSKKKGKENLKKIGLWLDHVLAHFIEFKKDKVIIQSVYSDLETRIRFKGETPVGGRVGKNRSTNREFNKHHREQNQLHDYYKALAKGLERYDVVYLFGPATAKNELLNWIRQKQHVENKTFVVDAAQEMSVNQMIARARTVLGKETKV